MPDDIFFLFRSPEAVFAFLVILAVGFAIGRFARFFEIRKERSDAVKRSQHTILGNVYEKVVPLLPGFPYSPKDMVFVGKGFDYLVIDGLAEGKVRQIVFLEVKTGVSSLNRNEREIRRAVDSKSVKWQEYRPDSL